MTADEFTSIYMTWRNRHIDEGADVADLTMAEFAAEICTEQDRILNNIRTYLYNAAKESPLITVVH